MDSRTAVRRPAIIGTATIGAVRATHFLVRGFDASSTEPVPGAEDRLRAYLDAEWHIAAQKPARAEHVH